MVLGCGEELLVAWSWLSGLLGPNFGFLPLSFLTPRGRTTLLRVDFSFLPTQERLVHHNHVVGAVRLVGVDG
jgi:hypothetical protein